MWRFSQGELPSGHEGTHQLASLLECTTKESEAGGAESEKQGCT